MEIQPWDHGKSSYMLSPDETEHLPAPANLLLSEMDTPLLYMAGVFFNIFFFVFLYSWILSLSMWLYRKRQQPNVFPRSIFCSSVMLMFTICIICPMFWFYCCCMVSTFCYRLLLYNPLLVKFSKLNLTAVPFALYVAFCLQFLFTFLHQLMSLI